MRTLTLLFILALFAPIKSYCQYKEDKEGGIALMEFEKKIDEAVVAANMAFLQKAYADDFRFKHSTGYVDDKASWLKDVEKNKGSIISRTFDSVEVEIHGDVGITNGILKVKRKDRAYQLEYVRVYVRKNGQWQMIMHRSVKEIES